MGVPSPLPAINMNMRTKKTKAVGIPTVDLSSERSTVKESIVTACEEYGFFTVVNHGVPPHVIARMEEEGSGFFSKPVHEKQRARVEPASPFGYGSKNIGRNGDMGELEYLLLHTHPLSVSETSKTLSNDPSKFRYISNYILCFYSCLYIYTSIHPYIYHLCRLAIVNIYYNVCVLACFLTNYSV